MPKEFKFYHSIIALYIIVSFGSYIGFVYPYASKFLLVLAVLMSVKLHFELSARRIGLFILLIIIYILISITMEGDFYPREHSILLPFFALISKRDVVSIYNSFIRLEVLSIIPSVIILIMVIIGIDSILPSYTIEEGRPFIVFPGTAIQPGQFTNIGGINFFRISGIQDEPGLMSGIVLFILIAEKFNLKPKRNKFLLVAGLLSFSFAFYVLLAVYLLLSFFVDNEIRKRIVDAKYVLMVVVIFLLLSGFYDFYIQSRLQAVDFSNPDSKSLRVNMRYDEYFNFYFSQKSDYVLFGHGISANKIDNAYAGAQVINFMGFLYNYGIIGFFLLFLSIGLIFNLKKKSEFIAFVVILLFFYQRPYIFNVGYFLLFFAISYSFDTHHYSKKDMLENKKRIRVNK